MISPDSSATLILNVGHDQTLLNTRDLVLRSAGYSVQSAFSAEDAIDRFRAGDFDLVLLCHSIPEQERKRLIDLIRNCGSAVPVLFVSAKLAPEAPFADLTVENQPRELLSAIRRLLSQKGGNA